MKRLELRAIGCVVVLASAGGACAELVDFEKDVLPVFREYCVRCHAEEGDKKRAGIALDLPEKIAAEIPSMLRPYDVEKSYIYELIMMPRSDDRAMPPNGDRVSDEGKEVLKRWIEQGLPIPGRHEPPPRPDGGEAGAPEAGGGAMVAEVFHPWMNLEGQRIEAKFGGIEGDVVILTMRNDVTYRYPLANLTADSQEQARKLAAGGGGE